jgi:ribosomal protein L37AE/L43A
MTGVRRNRLAVRTCPRCMQETLVSNGAFWICAGCRYAATSMALAMDQGVAEPSLRSPARSYRRSAARLTLDEQQLEAEPAYTAR